MKKEFKELNEIFEEIEKIEGIIRLKIKRRQNFHTYRQDIQKRIKLYERMYELFKII